MQFLREEKQHKRSEHIEDYVGGGAHKASAAQYSAARIQEQSAEYAYYDSTEEQYGEGAQRLSCVKGSGHSRGDSELKCNNAGGVVDQGLSRQQNGLSVRKIHSGTHGCNCRGVCR